MCMNNMVKSTNLYEKNEESFIWSIIVFNV